MYVSMAYLLGINNPFAGQGGFMLDEPTSLCGRRKTDLRAVRRADQPDALFKPVAQNTSTSLPTTRPQEKQHRRGRWRDRRHPGRRSAPRWRSNSSPRGVQEPAVPLSGLLLVHKEELFTHLHLKWKDLFNASYDVLLYDLTSIYFEGFPPNACVGWSGSF